MGVQYQAANIKAPKDVGSNDFGVRKFTATTTHAADAIPDAWCGKFVKLYCSGGDVHYGFSTSSSAEIDRSVSATAAGASAKVGGVLADGLANKEHVRIPSKQEGQTMYFVREGSASADVYMELSSG